jgi:diguanylate cyclase (GGDEF)-like protein
MVRILLTLFLAVSAVGILFLTYYTIRNIKTPGSHSVVLFMASVFVYTFGTIYELNESTVDGVYLALKIQYLGIPLVALSWFIFALQYNDYKIKNKLFYPALCVIPVITIILFYTNDYHHLHYKELSINLQGPFPITQNVKGFWYYVDFIYKDLMCFSGIFLFYLKIRKSRGYQKKQARMIFASSLIPGAGNVLTLLGFSPYGIDMNPVYLALSVPVFSYAMLRLRMFDIAPIARHKVFEGMRDPVIVLDIKNRIADYNPPASEVFPELTKESTGQRFSKVFRAHETFVDKINKSHNVSGEIDLQINGVSRHFSISYSHLLANSNNPIGSIILLYDITDHKLLQKKLHQMATIDALTQTYNRRYFMELCLREIKRVSRYKRSLSFLIIDFDHFKKINDTYGHPAGDLVLKNAAVLFKSILRDCDILGRYGGEEFAILLPETDLNGAKVIAERLIRKVLLTENYHQNTIIKTTISIGIDSVDFNQTQAHIDYDKTLDSLLINSDKAMYHAKKNGRNQVQVHIG